MKQNLYKIYFLTFLLLIDFVAFADDGPGDDDGGGGLEGDDPAPAPINGKLIWLAVLGVVFAYYSYRKARKTA